MHVYTLPMPKGGERQRTSTYSLKASAGIFIDDHPDIVLLVTAVLGPALGTLFVTMGQALQDGGDRLYVIGGVGFFVLTGGLQWARDFARRTLAKIDREQAEAVRVAFKAALQPVAEMIADLPTVSRADQSREIRAIAMQSTGGLLLMMRHVPDVRITVYKVDETGEQMDCISHQGRPGPRDPFHRKDNGRGAAAFRLVQRGGDPRFVTDNSDDDAMDQIDFHGTRNGYKTFITAAINNKNDGWGMVSVDAPLPDTLFDTDKHIVSLVADLLAIAFAVVEASEASTSQIASA